MPGELKNRKQLATTVDKKLLEGLDRLHKETRIPKSKLVDEAIEDLLKKHGIPIEEEGQS